MPWWRPNVSHGRRASDLRAPVAPEEIRKMTTHKMGRHVFGTVYAPQLPAKTLMEYMGITKFSVVQRYINLSKAEKVDQFEKATRVIEGLGGRPLSVGSSGAIAVLLDRLRALEPSGRENAWNAFLDGFKGLFGEQEKSDLEVKAVES